MLFAEDEYDMVGPNFNECIATQDVLICGWGDEAFMAEILRQLDAGAVSLQQDSEVPCNSLMRRFIGVASLCQSTRACDGSNQLN